MHGACMATKTISIDLEAYQKLSRARRTPKESFSQVIRRAAWPKHRKTCGNVLIGSKTAPLISEDTLKRLDAAQESDVIPSDKWND